MRKFGKVGIAIVVAASLALTACGGSKGSGGNGTNDQAPRPRPRRPRTTRRRWTTARCRPAARFASRSTASRPTTTSTRSTATTRTSANIMNAVLPQVWNFDAGGNPILNTDVVDKAEQTSTSPQTIHYHINTKAVWSDGTPITSKDFIGMWNALNGKNTAFQIASSNGYQNIDSVKQGDTANDVIVTFKADPPYPDWKSLFSPISRPRSMPARPRSTSRGSTHRRCPVARSRSARSTRRPRRSPWSTTTSGAAGRRSWTRSSTSPSTSRPRPRRCSPTRSTSSTSALTSEPTPPSRRRRA